MTVEEGLVAYLSGLPELTLLIGSQPVRLFPAGDTQGQPKPYLTYQKISGARATTLDNRGGLVSPDFQISVWGSGYQNAKQVVEVVREALEAVNDDRDLGGFAIQGLTIEDDRDLYSPPMDGGKKGTHGVALEFKVWHTETTG